eukprot:TRINITY_DN22593_c0_g1_i1.p1 TRINITY_DN22593_c0_g1~~TRINITY_DN22593_c0_g1_i1.p1  ORF type:complete len:132 (-),score=7.61 TRINITY_DN22593_c0_g1_i1:9-404(-)
MEQKQMKQSLSEISIRELCQLESIERDIIIEIVEYGIAKPIEDSESANWVFEISSVYWIKKAVQLYQELEIDWLAVSLLIELMQQRELLRKENEFFKQQLKRFVQPQVMTRKKPKEREQKVKKTRSKSKDE